MRRIFALLMAAALAGCASHSHVSINAGSVVTNTQVNGAVPYGSTVGALLALVGIAYAWNGAPAGNGFFLQMDETRKVQEHDCTKPLEDHSANLKCR